MEEDLISFCLQITSPARKLQNIMLSGSAAELPFKYYLQNPSDLDIMNWRRDFYAIPEENFLDVHKRFKGELFIIRTRNSPAGFARVINYASGSSIGRTNTYLVLDSVNSPAITQKGISLSDLRHRLKIVHRLVKLNLEGHEYWQSDLVCSLYCPLWPPEAIEWITRHRIWPPEQLIQKIVDDGCHLVPKAHHSHPNDKNEWRFSFSKAEYVLAHSWNESQKYIYHILRLIKCVVVNEVGGSHGTILRTYHIKTLMLWACEQNPKHFWDENKVGAAVKELLRQMIQWMIEKRCPNYFIPSCNLFESSSPHESMDKEISLLRNYLTMEDFEMIAGKQLNSEVFVNINVCSNFGMMVARWATHKTFVINPLPGHCFQLRYFSQRHFQLKFLVSELQFLHKAVSHQMEMCSLSLCNDVDKRSTAERKAKYYYRLTEVKFANTAQWSFTISCNDNIYTFLTALIFSCQNMVESNLADRNYEEIIPSNDELLEKSICYLRQYSGTVSYRHLFRRFSCDAIDCMNAINPSSSSGSTTCLNIHYFLAKAYEANFYYSCLGNYRNATLLCEKAFAEMRDARGFSSVLINDVAVMFPVVMSSKSSVIFDETMNQVFGFFTVWNRFKREPKSRIDSANSNGPEKLPCRLAPKLRISIGSTLFLEYIYRQCFLHSSCELVNAGLGISDFIEHPDPFLAFCLRISAQRRYVC